MALRITTWNVNGIRNPFGYRPWSAKKSFEDMFDILEADIVCFQETKIQKRDLTDDMVLVPGWDSYFTFPKHKKGYSGVAVYTRNSKCHAVKAEEGITGILVPPSHPGQTYKALAASECIGGYPDLSDEEALLLDSEGRALVLDFGAFVFIGAYCPANTAEERDNFRIAFVEALFNRVRNLVVECKRNVVVVGDLNIARDEIDSSGAKEMMKELGINDWKDTPTRGNLHRLLEPHPVGVMVDLCREHFPDRQGMFTHWDVKKNKRPGNAGSRIDYILCSSDMKSWFSEANIQEGLMGSDHCPVFVTFKKRVVYGGIERNTHDIVNPEGVFREGERQPSVPVPPAPRLCMKRFPEFSQRRNIKDMFSKMSSNQAAAKAQLSSSQASKPAQKVDLASGSPAKRLKTSPAIASKNPRNPKNPKNQKSQNQRSLRGFFQPSVDSTGTSPSSDTSYSQPVSPGDSSAAIPPATQERTLLFKDESTDLIDPIESKEKWTQLFTKRPPPVCDIHDEECIQLTTKKPGPNCGRAFWMCQRPIGPQGESVVKSGVKTEWKCNFFKWASDL